jgi:hypothetical protein
MAISVVLAGSINAPLGSVSEQGVGVNAVSAQTIILVQGLSSDIPIASAPLSILLAYNDVFIQNIVMMTDATGLATGTNFEVLTDDATGLKTIFASAVSGLGANATIDMYTASVTKQRTVVHKGKHLQIGNTVGAGTGSGKWYMYIWYLPLSPNGVLNPLN